MKKVITIFLTVLISMSILSQSFYIASAKKYSYRCTRCHDKGYVLCPICGGTGRAYNVVFDRFDNCTRCHLKGRLKCPMCGGKYSKKTSSSSSKTSKTTTTKKKKSKFSYKKLGNKRIKITGFRKASKYTNVKKIKIPKKINGYKVVKIGKKAFKRYKKLKTAIVPRKVKIAKGAFPKKTKIKRK